jgi:lipoate-protein ligase A
MEEWLLLRSGAASAALNMAIDEVLLQHVGQLDRPVLRFYSWSEPAASFGYFQRHDDVSRTVSLRPLVRRPTGGGIVPHDNDWTYSLVFPPTHPWYALKAVDSYERVHEWVRSAFEAVGVSARLAPESRREAPGQCFAGAERFDVLLDDRKIAGAAQRRTRDGLLVQGSVQPPPGFVRTAWEEAMCECATRHWKARWTIWSAPEEFLKRAHALAADKYAAACHNERR